LLMLAKNMRLLLFVFMLLFLVLMPEVVSFKGRAQLRLFVLCMLSDTAIVVHLRQRGLMMLLRM
jgi:hypothetical protein